MAFSSPDDGDDTGAGERNFHIFHQLLCRPDGALGAASRLPLGAPVSYAYLARGGCLHAPAIDDDARCVQAGSLILYLNSCALCAGGALRFLAQSSEDLLFYSILVRARIYFILIYLL